jgi:Asp-tRNA(Asn)/Glu-tRNA(Gln) amidotransferase A subunit family amidase
MAKAVKILTKHGMTIEEVSLPAEFGDPEELGLTQKMILHGGAKAAFLGEYRHDKTLLSQRIRDLVENRSGFTVRDVLQATDNYAALRPVFDKFASSYDAVITPSAIDVAPEGLDDMGNAWFNFFGRCVNCTKFCNYC